MVSSKRNRKKCNYFISTIREIHSADFKCKHFLESKNVNNLHRTSKATYFSNLFLNKDVSSTLQQLHFSRFY